MTELEPCPFCGREGFLTTVSDWSVVSCTRMLCQGYQSMLTHANPESAVSAWNARTTPADLTQRVDHIDQQGYVHWKISNDTKGPRSIDDATGRDRSVPGTSTQNDPKLSSGQRAIEEAIGKLHIATSQLTDQRNVPRLILEAIDKLNWISANPESFSATPADHSVPVAIYQRQIAGSWAKGWTDISKEEYDKKLYPLRTYRVVYTAPQAPQPEAQSVRDAWISVDERLPEIIEMYPGSGTGNSEPVLVYLADENDDGGQIAVWRCFRGGQGDTTTIYWDWKTPEVTHWMPLPEAPK